jgi:hypothetical protein
MTTKPSEEADDKPHKPTTAPGAPGESQHVEAALDEALEETFPASDAVDMQQFAEMEQDAAVKPDDDKELDRVAIYLKGPTSFCA